MGLAWSRLPPGEKLLVLFVVIALIVTGVAVATTYNKDSKKDSKNVKRKKFNSKKLEEAADRQLDLNKENAGSMGLLDPTEEISNNAKCFMPQYIPGSCVAGYKPSTETVGCCDPEDSSSQPVVEGLKIAAKISKQLMISIAFDALVVNRLTAWGNEAIRAARSTAKTAQAAVRSTVNAGRTAAKVTKTGVQVATKVSTKVSTAAAKRGAMASMGPVGWAVLAAEVTLAIIDFFDPFGFGSFKSNTINMNTRKLMDYLVQKNVEDAGGTYPLLITGVVLWPEVYQIAISELFSFVTSKIDENLSTDEEYLKGAENVDLVDFMEFYSGYIDKKTDEYFNNEENRKEIDKILYDKMLIELGNISPEFKGDIQYNEDVYKTHGTGIIATRQGVSRWNSRYKDKWENNDPISQDILVGLYTNEYLVADKLDPDFTADEPVMKTKKLNYYLPTFNLHASVINSCLKKVSVKNGPDINPVSLGVTYDYDKGICNYSERFCDRYGLDHRTVTDDQTGIEFTNCKSYPGQEVNEAILGTTLTRAINQLDKALEDAISNFFDPPRKPTECVVPRGDDVEGICNTPDDCNDIGENEGDFVCIKDYGSEIRDGRCVSSSTVPYIGATCTSREGPTYKDFKCGVGTYCDLGEDHRPEWGKCKFGFSESYGDIPNAICLGSREVYKYNPYNEILEQDDDTDLEMIQTGCALKRRFDYDNIGKRDRCPDGYIDIAYDRSNCALGARRAYCVREDQKDVPGGYKLFNKDDVIIRTK